MQYEFLNLLLLLYSLIINKKLINYMNTKNLSIIILKFINN